VIEGKLICRAYEAESPEEADQIKTGKVGCRNEDKTGTVKLWGKKGTSLEEGKGGGDFP